MAWALDSLADGRKEEEEKECVSGIEKKEKRWARH